MAQSATLLLLAVTLPAASVDAVKPASALAASGGSPTTVVIEGSGFTGATTVTFGGTNAASFVVDSDTRITAVAPDHAIGKCNVVVNGTITAINIFTYKQSTTAALVINVTATINRILSLVWTANTLIGSTPQTDGATDPLTWPLGNMLVSQIKTTDAAATPPGVSGYDFEIRNTGNSTASIAGTVADTTGANAWTAGAVVASNVYYMAVSTAKEAPTPTWNSLDAGYVLNSNVAIDGLVPFELKFQAPSALTPAAMFNTAHTFTVTFTATAGP